MGIREHGWSYAVHFMGPSLYDLKVGEKTYHLRLLAPIYAPIELISHLSRVFTLAVPTFCIRAPRSGTFL